MFNISEIDQEIVKFILLNKKVHYHDIMKITGLSRKTIANHLDQLEITLQSMNINLVRKRGDGIYFVGDTDTLLSNVRTREINNINRTDIVLKILLLNVKPITIQKMADQLYVSRNTLQADLKQTRSRLKINQLNLVTTSKGLQVLGPEKQKRHMLSELLNDFWNGNLQEQSNIKWPSPEMHGLFSEPKLTKLVLLIQRFLDREMINYTDYQIQNLTIHVAIVINRVKCGQFLDSNNSKLRSQLLAETKELIEIINQAYQVRLPSIESDYINLHLATLKRATKNDNYAFKQVQNFLKAILVGNDYDELLIRDLSLHLLATIDRLKANLSIKNPYVGEVKRNFPYSFDRAAQLMEAVQQQYGIAIPEDEVAYVALHFQSYLERKLVSAKVDAIIICSTGLGMSRFLEQRIDKVYRDKINVVDVMSLSQFEKSPTDVPLILSTVDVKLKNQAFVLVSPLLEELDKEKINKALENIITCQDQTRAFTELIDLQRIYLKPEIKTKQDAITFLGNQLEKQGLAKTGVVQSALDRERISSTRMREIGVPHAKAEYIKLPSISILLNPNGLDWNGKKVYLIFFIGLNDSVRGHIRKIYKYFSLIIQPTFMKLALQCKNEEAIYQLVIQYLRK